MSEPGDSLFCMGIGAEESIGDAYEAALDAAYAEADLDWSEEALERALDWEYDGLNAAGVDEHARAVVEDASPFGLVSRLREAPSPGMQPSRRSRALTDTLDLLRAADRLASWVTARQAALTAEVFHEVHRESGSRTGEPDPRFSFALAAQEIAPLLRVPGRTAHRMVGEALRLTEELPATWEALEDGSISPAQAQVIVEESGSIPVEALSGFEETVLESAGELTRKLSVPENAGR
jgi:hypothetical protein